jgi:DNA mismatch repair protein MutS
VYLAHVGSFVPAAAARISLVDKVFAKFSVSDDIYHSTFNQEMMRLRDMVYNATDTSLILIDEFGNSTNMFDGISLLVSFLETMTTTAKPMILATTHYRELHTFNLIPESPIIKYYAMEVTDDSEPQLLYKLLPGTSRDSMGIQCAKWAGLNTDTIERAEEVIHAKLTGDPLRPLQLKSHKFEKALKLVKILAATDIDVAETSTLREKFGFNL